MPSLACHHRGGENENMDFSWEKVCQLKFRNEWKTRFHKKTSGDYFVSIKESIFIQWLYQKRFKNELKSDKDKFALLLRVIIFYCGRLLVPMQPVLTKFKIIEVSISYPTFPKCMAVNCHPKIHNSPPKRTFQDKNKWALLITNFIVLYSNSELCTTRSEDP